MTAPDRDPAALAREVLDADKVRDSTPGTLYLDGPTHEHEEAASAILDAAPTLARAVIELTAERDAYREENTRLREQAARVKALADRLDAEAADDFDGVSGTSVSLVKYETTKAIRAALNGGDQ